MIKSGWTSEITTLFGLEVDNAQMVVLYKYLKFFLILVAPVMNLKIRGGTDRSVDLEWEGSVVLTDFLVTYTPSSTGGKQKASSLLHKKGI